MRFRTAVAGIAVVALVGAGGDLASASKGPAARRAPTPLAKPVSYASNTGINPLPQACGSQSAVYALGAFYLAAQLGVTQVRCDLSWWTVQPSNATHFDWTQSDNAVNAAAHFKIKILFTLAWTPPWARPNPLPKGAHDASHVPPKNTSDYVRFVDAALNRYSPIGKARVKSVVGSVREWEVWNEPNIWSGFTPDDPVAYGTFLATAAASIHKIDRSATVLSGGMSPAVTKNGDWAPQDFINKMAPTGALKQINVVAVHPYGFPSWPDEQINFNPFFHMVPLLYQAMVNNGAGKKKIWATEGGWPTASQATRTIRTWDHNKQVGTEAYQAQELPLTIVTWFKFSYAGPFFIYDERDTCTTNTNWLCRMGVERSDGSRKPAWATVHAQLGAVASTPGAPSIVSVTPGVNKLSVAYTAPSSDGGSAITGYRATCVSSDGGRNMSSALSLANPLAVGSLTSGKTYTCTVVAKNATGFGAASAASPPVVVATVPGAPSIVSVTPGTKRLSVTYAAPSSNGGAAITGYKATCVSSDGGRNRPSTLSLKNPLVVSSATSGKTYTCTVAAKNGVGYGAPSPPSTAVIVL